MEVFAAGTLRKFEDLVLAHLKKFFPNQCKALGEARIRETIRYGVDRARGYQIVAERDVCKYIDLVIVLGRDFDTDDELPWAGRILRASRPPAEKVERVRDAAKMHLKDS